mmetsp:Transcript_135770/g.433188  ORF Transcript_135770/g.433188 Transcript_135770/m.433188 type:complete len:95 (+) Transcript_135770:847-1131(+)
MLGSDVVWVAGNTLWAMQDILCDLEDGSVSAFLVDTALVLFAVCGVGMVLSRLVTNKEGQQLTLAGAHSVVSRSRSFTAGCSLTSFWVAPSLQA